MRERDRQRRQPPRVTNIQNNFNVTQNNIEVNLELAETRMRAEVHIMEARQGDRNEINEICASIHRQHEMAVLNVHHESSRMDAQAQHHIQCSQAQLEEQHSPLETRSETVKGS